LLSLYENRNEAYYKQGYREVKKPCVGMKRVSFYVEYKGLTKPWRKG